MATLGTLSVHISANTGKLKAGLKKAEGMLQNFARTTGVSAKSINALGPAISDVKQTYHEASSAMTKDSRGWGKYMVGETYKVVNGQKVLVSSTEKMAYQTKQSFGYMMHNMFNLSAFMGKIIHYLTFSIGVQMVMMFRQAISNIIDIFKRFESSVVNAAAVSGYLGESFNTAVVSINRLSRELAGRTVFTLTEVSEAMYTIASAGIDPVKTSVEELLPILQYAQAHQTDLSEATKYVITTLKQFKMGLEDTNVVVDTFTSLITNSFMTAEKMANAFQYVGQIAGELNQDFRETASVLTLLTDRGYTGAQAGQRLNMIFAKLLKPTEKAQRELATLGLRLTDLDPSTHSIVDILHRLKAANFSVANSATMFRARTAAAAATVVSAVNEIEEYVIITKQMGGITDYIAKKQMATLEGSFKKLAGDAEEAAISIGEFLGSLWEITKWSSSKAAESINRIPILSDIVDIVGGGLDYISKGLTIMKAISTHTDTYADALAKLTRYGDDNMNMLQRNVETFKTYSEAIQDVNTIREQMSLYITDAQKNTAEYKQLVSDLTVAELEVTDAENSWIRTSTKILTTLYDMGGAIAKGINSYKDYHEARSEVIRLEERETSLNEELIDLQEKMNEAEEGSEEYARLRNRHTSATADLKTVTEDLVDARQEEIDTLNYYNLILENANARDKEWLEYASQIISLQGDLFRAQANRNEAYIEYERLLDIVTNKEIYLAEAMLSVYDAEDKLYELENKIYKLDEEQIALNDELFSQLAEEGLLTEDIIKLYEEMKKAEAEEMKLRDDYASVIGNLTEEELDLVEAYMKGEDVDISGISGFETIIAMKVAMDAAKAAQEAYANSVQGTAQHYIDAGIASNEISDTLTEIKDKSNDADELASEYKLAVDELEEAWDGVNGIMKIHQEDVDTAKQKWIDAKTEVSNYITKLGEIDSDIYTTHHITVVYGTEAEQAYEEWHDPRWNPPPANGDDDEGNFYSDFTNWMITWILSHFRPNQKGGIFSKATAGVFGEAGAEALVPLEGSNRKFGERILQNIIPKYYPDLMFQGGGIFGRGTITNTTGDTFSESYTITGPITVVSNNPADIYEQLKGRARAASPRR